MKYGPIYPISVVESLTSNELGADTKQIPIFYIILLASTSRSTWLRILTRERFFVTRLLPIVGS
jgi:hypothetical protein